VFRSGLSKSLSEKVICLLWPRRGFRRAWAYRMKRLSRLKVSEHRVALGFAAGAFASFTPFMGLHFVIAASIACLVRGSLIASAIGTVIGNPLTFPFIWLTTYQLGTALLGLPIHEGGEGSMQIASTSLETFASSSASEIWTALEPVLLPMVVGAVPLGLLCAAASYAIVLCTIRRMRAYPGRRFNAALARERSS
jgi:uncharacterized protein